MTGICPEIDDTQAAQRLRAAGLRPTRQRVALVGLLYAHGKRHLTAETLHDEAVAAGIEVSLATVYNTLHQFTKARMLRQVAVDAARFYFDTNVDPHQHFYDQDHGILIDIPGDAIKVTGVPNPPRGTVIDRVDVVIRTVADRMPERRPRKGLGNIGDSGTSQWQDQRRPRAQKTRAGA
ncbi:MAG: transcriptional repressor [Alphaproteobacteria bacterium]|nr:transcriptional repressor [Alphaproteobacteria bacterium]MBU6472567.1 transcriptional repressor [Alphaproteobacteria bacterium]MDE2011434.1 transcriptional repressor [Alphaproteobacteria bacterium]MDE2071825.1 transcriptional repressor [Alphaproteobacteria bacterium]MDE2350502.1 transcriptional repressor [Alphaproteobacteria bacterium]